MTLIPLLGSFITEPAADPSLMPSSITMRTSRSRLTFNCRSLENPPWPMGWFSNPCMWFGSGAMIAWQMAFAYAPAFNRIVQTALIGILEWSWIVAIAAVRAATVEAAKWLQRSGHRRPAPLAGVCAMRSTVLLAPPA